jgi:cobalt-zinc-cadmium efflux system outer membrane protein
MSTRRALGAVMLAMAVRVAPARADEAAVAPTPPQKEAPSLGEDALLRRWLDKSPEVAAWRSRVGAARFDATQARLWPNPEAAFSTNVLADGAAPDSQWGFQLQLGAPLPIFGQIAGRGAAADAQIGVAEAAVLEQLWERAAELRAAMIERAFADARAEMLERNLEELDRLRRVVVLRTGAGAGSQYDVLRVDMAAGTLRAALNEATVERARAETALLALIADPSLASAPATRAGLAPLRAPEDEAALVKLALERRPDLLLARRGVAASQAQATRDRRDAIPTPSVFAAGYLCQQPYGLQLTAGLSVPLPIFDRNQGAIGRSLAEAQGAEQQARALEARTRVEVGGAWRARQHARAALDDFRTRTLATAAELLRRAEVTYQAGAFSIAELFDAYQTMWAARLQELDLDRQVAAAEAELKRAAALGLP